MSNRKKATAVALLLCVSVAAAAAGSVMAVGPQRAVKTLAEAAALARDGDTIEVDAGL